MRGETTAPGENDPDVNRNRASRPPSKDDSLRAKVRERIRVLLPDSLHLRDEQDADDKADKKKQRKPPEPPKHKKQGGRPTVKTAPAQPQPVTGEREAGGATTPEKNP